MLLRPRTRGLRGTRIMLGERSGFSLSVTVGRGRWLSRRRKEGVEKWSLETEEGVRAVWGFEERFLRGVAKGWRRERGFEEGVRLCLRESSGRCFLGVAWMDIWSVSVFEGVPSCSRSNSPRTCPSFCGVGPRTVFFEGVKRFRITDGDSYGSTSQG